tara:strand:+ start:10686 stop:11108 length:423 start_codon:yes stop_codon:yes gene_type:complete
MKQLFENWRHYLLEDMDTEQVRKAVLINDEDKALILKSSDLNEKHAGEWDLPGGHIHEGEDDIDGLKREVKEETDLDITSPEMILHDGRKKFYKTRSYSGTIKLSEEHTEYEWVTIDEIDSYNIGAKFVKAVKAALNNDD